MFKMAKLFFPYLSIFLLNLGLQGHLVTGQAFVCPSTDIMAPCTCDEYERLYCVGPSVTQEAVDRAIEAVKEVNIDQQPRVYIDKFRVKSTNLTELNLTGLLNTTIRALQVYANPNLVKIFVNPSPKILATDLSSAFIEASEIIGYSNKLDNEGVRNFLPYLTPAGSLHDIRWSENNFEFLDASVFKNYLDADEQNEIGVGYNPFICDERMSWIKADRERYESRVQSVNCVNDPGQNVFNSTLVP